MKSKFQRKSKLIFAVVIIAIVAVGYWIATGPKKEIAKKIQWLLDDETKMDVPSFLIHYKWNGIEEPDPTWAIFPKEGKWWVIDHNRFKRAAARSKTEAGLKKELRKYWQEFSSRWIENCSFEPKASRYEAVMTALGFDMIFNLEKTAFRDFLKGIEDYKTGKLRLE